ncbi:hypothetical protein F511_04936 [Dorcoceras hygrometricum]|uniref:Uncharacterized protein n=1 Tax=Dorcoceras hygrometricum TaxID=472368 RepID=A0A2Z7BK21_9LAMI|nr:hypothetical protein F511_04936 [Dorcoceras hygrometricum]
MLRTSQCSLPMKHGFAALLLCAETGGSCGCSSVLQLALEEPPPLSFTGASRLLPRRCRDQNRGLCFSVNTDLLVSSVVALALVLFSVNTTGGGLESSGVVLRKRSLVCSYLEHLVLL